MHTAISMYIFSLVHLWAGWVSADLGWALLGYTDFQAVSGAKSTLCTLHPPQASNYPRDVLKVKGKAQKQRPS